MTEPMQAAVDPKLFRQALGQCPTGVCVVTAAAAIALHLAKSFAALRSPGKLGWQRGVDLGKSLFGREGASAG